MQIRANGNFITGNTPVRSILFSQYLHILALIVIGAACYSNTFHVPFILDDESSIQLHTPAHGLANFFKDGAGYNHLPNRAFGYLTFALNYEFGQLNLPGYHLVNLLIHISTSLLVYAFTRLLFRTPLMTQTQELPQGKMFAFIVALFFTCHPIQTQAVTYIVQRFTSLTTMLYLAALICYLRWRLLQTDMTQATQRQGLGWYCLAMLSTILAMKTKEISVTLPVIILLFEYSFFGAPKRKLLAKLTPLLMTLAIIPVTTFLKFDPVVKSTGGGVGAYLSDTQSNPYDIVRMTRWEYLYTQFNVICTYFRLLLFPVNQHLDYDYPINQTIFEPRALFALTLILTILAATVFMFAKSRKTLISTSPDNPVAVNPSTATAPMLLLAAFGIFWFFITLSIESSIIAIRDVIYEHRLYLPSYGFILTMTALATLMLNQAAGIYPKVRQLAFITVTGLIVVLSIATYSRNAVWGDWITLWTDNVSKAPNKPRPHNILGIGYYYKGNFEAALKEYHEAIRLKPDFIEAYYNIALVHSANRNYKEAINFYLKVLNLSAFDAPRHASAYNEIGINYAELNDSDQSVRAFESAVKYEPESAEFRNNYAFALSNAGKIDEAVQQFREALRLDPGNSYAMQALQGIRQRPDRTGLKQTPFADNAPK